MNLHEEDGGSERLHKYMARCGVASRRACEKIIEQGRVKVNGTVVESPGCKIGDGDVVTLDGQKISPQEKMVYIAFNKPEGCVTSVTDPQGRKTVMEYIQGIDERIYPVGRLDYDTEGLLLFTNDGDLTKALTHPVHEVEKEYHALVRGVPNASALHRLSAGVDMGDWISAPGRAEILWTRNGNALVRVVIHEGKKHQVKLMLETVGYPVLHLKRTRIGAVELGSLASGQWRNLTEEEINALAGRVRKIREK
jgi:23S rRNA pseudouridine2605 synthase